MEMTEGKKNKSVSFYVTALGYILFNLRLASDPLSSLLATGKQILTTAPYVIGITYVAVAVVQYMAQGERVPWPQRIRLFFTLGIFAGLVYAIYEYTGVQVVQ